LNSFSSIRSTLYLPAVAVIAIGLLMRLYACWATYIIPPDGALYLYQAKMIVTGQWGKLTGCGLTYVSNLPFFIALFYTLLRDWVVAAQSVSLFFGTATLVLAYFILREFCKREISTIATLILSLTPVMVSRSADVVRGPVFWFFLSLGIYFFIRGIKSESAAILLLFSQIAFLMGAWARIEGILAIPVSLAYLIVFIKGHHIRQFFYFCIPLLILAAALFAVHFSTGKQIASLYRNNEVVVKVTKPLKKYHKLRNQIRVAVEKDMPSPMRRFLPEARSSIWLVAFGVLFNRICEGFFYPYLLIYLAGLKGFRNRLIADKRLFYFVLMCASIVMLLYMHTLNTWTLHYRMIIFLILPSILFAAFGLENISDYLTVRTRIRRNLVLVGVTVLIVVAGIPKNVKLRDPEKMVYRKIGAKIAQSEKDPEGRTVVSAFALHRWISLYANMDVDTPPCPEPDRSILFPKSIDELTPSIRQWKKRHIGYYLWQEKNWSGDESVLEDEAAKANLVLLGSWTHPDTGRLMLFKIKADPSDSRPKNIKEQ